MRENTAPDELDRATRARLARLANAPVDTTNLERRLQAALAAQAAAPTEPPAHGGRRFHAAWALCTSGGRGWMAASGLAAALVLAASIVGAILLATASTPVTAAPADLARLHDAVNADPALATAVASMAEARRVIAGQWSDAPRLPTASGPDDQVHACCLRDLKGRKVVSVLIHDSDDTPITMVVARRQDVKPAPGGTAVERNGRTYQVHDSHGLRMVMAEGDERYVCLMGALPVERLLEIAAGLDP